MRRLALALALLAPVPALAGELPSFLVSGDAFCTSQADFDDYSVHGKLRPGSAIETCVLVDRPTRVAVIGGTAGVKTMVRVIGGPYAWNVGWTNGALPLAQ